MINAIHLFNVMAFSFWSLPRRWCVYNAFFMCVGTSSFQQNQRLCKLLVYEVMHEFNKLVLLAISFWKRSSLAYCPSIFAFGFWGQENEIIVCSTAIALKSHRDWTFLWDIFRPAFNYASDFVSHVYDDCVHCVTCHSWRMSSNVCTKNLKRRTNKLFPVIAIEALWWRGGHFFRSYFSHFVRECIHCMGFG